MWGSSPESGEPGLDSFRLLLGAQDATFLPSSLHLDSRALRHQGWDVNSTPGSPWHPALPSPGLRDVRLPQNPGEIAKEWLQAAQEPVCLLHQVLWPRQGPRRHDPDLRGWGQLEETGELY